MEPNREAMRDALLSRLPRPENLPAYRKEVSALLQHNEKILRRQKWYAGAIWFWVVGLGVALIFLAGMHPEKPNAAWLAASLGSFACFMLIYGAAEVLKYFINRTRVELLKESKQVQLQVLELHDLVRRGGS
jgi:hypothetical protein